MKFILEFELSDFLIIDDDKSLYGIDNKMKNKLISTELTKGFNSDKLKEANEKIKNCS